MYLPAHVSQDAATAFLLFGASKGKGGESVTQWSSLVGIVTAIVGNILISFALNIQRYAHIRIDQDYQRIKQERKARKKLPRALRGYGTAVQQNQAAEERARINATAPGPGLEADDVDDDSSDASETSPLNGSIHSDDTVKPADKQDKTKGRRKSYLSSPYWWLGISLMAVGEAGNFLAYGFAPASIVSPLGVVALISNCIIAPFMLKERFRKRDFWGVLVAIGGAVTIVLSARTSEEKMGPDRLWQAIKRWEFLAYVCITLVVIIVLMVASPRYGRRTILIDLGLVGLFGGYTALSTKGVAAMLSGSLFRAFTFPITYALVAVLIASAVMQIRYINRALSNFNSTQVIPTQFVLFTLSVIIGSAVLYRDFEKTDLEHVAKFIAGCLLTFSGVWLITSGRKNGDDDDDDDDEHTEDETIRLIDEEQTSNRQNSVSKEHIQSSEALSSQPDGGRRSTLAVSEHSTHPESSLTVTPADLVRSISDDPYSISAISSERLARPKTPREATLLSTTSDSTPFFTPSSAPANPVRPHHLVANNSDSALLSPITPTRNGRVTPSRPSIVLPTGETFETPPTSVLRSARGSIKRLIPAPLIPPLPGALNTIVAESLLRGEGSPRRIRDTLRRQRSIRNRSLQTSTAPTVPQSAIESPPVSRWTTRDDDIPETPRTAISDYFPSPGDQDRQRRRSRLGSFGDTLSDFFKKSKNQDRNRDRDHDNDNEHIDNRE